MGSTGYNVYNVGGMFKIPWGLEWAIQLRQGRILDGGDLKSLLIPGCCICTLKKNTNSTEDYNVKNERSKYNVAYWIGSWNRKRILMEK